MSKLKLTPLQIMKAGPVIPVIVIDHVDYAVPLARALAEGGVKILEVTLRTPAALDAIKMISTHVPDVIVGAGTVLTPEQFAASGEAGAQFIISPGLTSPLIEYAAHSDIPFLPGVSTISEIMQGMDAGMNEFKFFPAEANGGTKTLKAIGGPFPDVKFCPTGGITPDNARDYLALKNVICVGGSWLVTQELLSSRNYGKITDISRNAMMLNQ